MAETKLHKYFTPKRPPGIGAVPKNGLKVTHFCGRRSIVQGCSRPVWGWVEYDRELTASEVNEYELLPAQKAAARVPYFIPNDYIEIFFGSRVPAYYEVQLANAMISAKLPKDVEWSGNELYASYEDWEEVRGIWESAFKQARDEFMKLCDDALFDDAPLIDASQKYGVPLPLEYNAM